MKERKMLSKLEVYVCNFGKECSKKDSPELADKLKKWAKEEQQGEIKIIRSGCLGQCDDSIAIACYPEKKFILDCRKDDFEEIKKSLLEALSKI
jgi:predicted metal-binding protein